MKKKLLIALLFVSTLLLFSCGSSYQSSAGGYAKDSYYSDYMYPEETVAAYEYYEYDEGDYEYESPEPSLMANSSGSAKPSNGSASDTRKIIRTENLTLETKTFDQAVKDLTEGVAKLGGYVESSYISGQSLNAGSSVARYANFSFRIPAAAMDEYVSYADTICHMTSHSTNATDITDRYYDAEARLNSLLTQEERLLAMLEKAEDLKYMLELEDKLSEVRYEIESYYSTLSRYDKQVSYSTVTIDLQEVMEYKTVTELPKSFGERMATAMASSWEDFVDGWQDFLIDFTYAIPGLIVFLVIVAIIVIVVIAIVKSARKKKARRYDAWREQQEAAAMANSQREAGDNDNSEQK